MMDEDKTKSVRANWMLGASFLGVFMCFAAILFFKLDANSAVGGAIIMAAGKFLSGWGTAFDWEFGSSKGSQQNQAALRDVATNTAPPNSITIPLPDKTP